MEASAIITDSAREFSDALAEGGALLAIDLGTKTLGVATCDAGWQFATAGKTLPRGKFGRDRDALATLLAERSVMKILNR